MPIAGLTPGALTLAVSTNGCIRVDLTLRDPSTGLAMDFTGYTAELQVRASPGAAASLVTLISATPNANNSQVIMSEQTDCCGNAYTQFEVFISNLDIDTIVAGLPMPLCEDYPPVYDLVLTASDADANPYLSGAIALSPGVSR